MTTKDYLFYIDLDYVSMSAERCLYFKAFV